MEIASLPGNASRAITMCRTLDSIAPDLQYATNLSIYTHATREESKEKASRKKEKDLFLPYTKTLCRLASLSYEDDEEIKRRLSSSEWAREGWTFLKSSRNYKDGYFGAAFWEEENEQLVIVHKGTNCIEDVKTDIEGIINQRYTSQIHSASTFASLVVADFKKTECDVTIVGHSLGGWLAPMSAFAIKYFRLEGRDFRPVKELEETYDPFVATFDPPGCREVLFKLSKRYFNDFQSSAFIRSLQVQNYFITPNLINIWNSHIGKMYSFKRIRFLSPSSGLSSRLIFTALSHKISNFVYKFDTCSYPKFKYEASEWPKFSLLKAFASELYSAAFFPLAYVYEVELTMDLVFGINPFTSLCLLQHRDPSPRNRCVIAEHRAKKYGLGWHS